MLVSLSLISCFADWQAFKTQIGICLYSKKSANCSAFTGFVSAVVFVSKKPIKTKLLTTILPILFYLPATYIFLLGLVIFHITRGLTHFCSLLNSSISAVLNIYFSPSHSCLIIFEPTSVLLCYLLLPLWLLCLFYFIRVFLLACPIIFFIISK